MSYYKKMRHRKKLKTLPAKHSLVQFGVQSSDAIYSIPRFLIYHSFSTVYMYLYLPDHNYVLTYRCHSCKKKKQTITLDKSARLLSPPFASVTSLHLTGALHLLERRESLQGLPWLHHHWKRKVLLWLRASPTLVLVTFFARTRKWNRKYIVQHLLGPCDIWRSGLKKEKILLLCLIWRIK